MNETSGDCPKLQYYTSHIQEPRAETRILSVDECSTYLECLVEADGQRFEVVVCPTSDSSVMNADGVNRFYAPQSVEENPPQNPNHPYQVVVPVQPEGSCVAKCTFCPYGSVDSRPYASAETIIDLLTAGRDIALQHGVVNSESSLKFSLLKGGDISFNRNIGNVIAAIASRFPSNTLKLSSIGARNTGFLERLLDARASLGDYQISLQLSVNSTDEAQRHEIVNGGQSGNIHLYNLADINQFASSWRQYLGRRVTTTFTLQDHSIFDVAEIRNHLSPDNAVIKLRRLHPSTGRPIGEERYRKIHQTLTEAGYTVIVGNPTYSELAHKLTPRRNFELYG